MVAFFIEQQDLLSRLGTSAWPLVFDVCRHEKYCAMPRGVPTAMWRQHRSVDQWVGEIPLGAEVVIACVHGHNVSQLAVSALRAKGIKARVLKGGVDGWVAAGLPSVTKAALPGRDEALPSRWITRLRPKIDRIACPWLIRRFIDRHAEVLFVEPEHVLAVAEERGAIAFDVAGAPFEHDGPLCTFDTLQRAFAINDPALDVVAKVVRAADTAQLELAPEAAGLLAMSLGVSHLAGEDDKAALMRGMPLYDALYAWARHARGEQHNWPLGQAPTAQQAGRGP